MEQGEAEKTIEEYQNDVPMVVEAVVEMMSDCGAEEFEGPR